MAAATRVHVIYHPYHGLDFQVVFHVAGTVIDPNNAAVQAVITAINRVTRAVAIEISLSVVGDVAGTVTDGVAYTSGDKAFITGIDADGSAHNFKVPGPKATIIEGDKETIDFTNALVIAYQTAVQTHALSPGGAAVSSVLSGRRAMNRKPLKNSGVLVV